MTHQKRLPAPRHYPIERKSGSYVATLEDSRSPESAIPAGVFLRDVTDHADSLKQARRIVKEGNLLRNGDPVSDVRHGIGVMDVVSLPPEEETYRVVRRGESLEFVPVRKGTPHAAKIVSKRDGGDQYQYGLHNGETYLSKEEHETGSTLVFRDEAEEVPLEEGARAIAVEGAHAGETGELEEIHEMGTESDTAEVEGFETRLENLMALSDLKVTADE